MGRKASRSFAFMIPDPGARCPLCSRLPTHAHGPSLPRALEGASVPNPATASHGRDVVEVREGALLDDLMMGTIVLAVGTIVLAPSVPRPYSRSRRTIRLSFPSRSRFRLPSLPSGTPSRVPLDSLCLQSIPH
jgi:hypothetical protein